ncbi:MAG: anti-sigma factor family protein [Caldilineaceae bacterium]
MNFRPSHIPFDRLVDWVEARLSAEERDQLQRHLTSCAHCRQELTQIERLFGLLQSDTTVDPPAAVVNRAVRIFRPRQAEVTPPLLQRIVAALQFDSLQLAPSMGLRSGAATPRQLLFSAGDYDLDLRLTPTEQTDGWLFTGQVLGSDTPTGRVTVEGATGVVETSLSMLGEFVLPPITAGNYTLVVQLADAEITVDTIQVGS